MPKSLDPLHDTSGVTRIYFDLPKQLAEQLKVRAAQERTYMRTLLTKIVSEYLNAKTSKK